MCADNGNSGVFVSGGFMQVNQSQVSQNNIERKVERQDVKEVSVDSMQQANKKQVNAAILQGAIDQVGNGIQDQPMSLVLKSALQGINEALQDIQPEASLKDSYESGIDFSPEAVAERIVSFSTNFFSAYQEQHPELSEQEARDSFTELMIGGVEQGVGEAKEILEALSVLEGDVADNIDKTMELILERFESFRNPEEQVEA